jgi:hypothetical protein
MQVVAVCARVRVCDNVSQKPFYLRAALKRAQNLWGASLGVLKVWLLALHLKMACKGLARSSSLQWLLARVSISG